MISASAVILSLLFLVAIAIPAFISLGKRAPLASSRQLEFATCNHIAAITWRIASLGDASNTGSSRKWGKRPLARANGVFG
jgi:hypothetical protein